MELKSYGKTRVLKIDESTTPSDLAQKISEIESDGHKLVFTVGNFLIFQEQ